MFEEIDSDIERLTNDGYSLRFTSLQILPSSPSEWVWLMHDATGGAAVRSRFL
jgi:hypothetical protein